MPPQTQSRAAVGCSLAGIARGLAGCVKWGAGSVARSTAAVAVVRASTVIAYAAGLTGIVAATAKAATVAGARAGVPRVLAYRLRQRALFGVRVAILRAAIARSRASIAGLHAIRYVWWGAGGVPFAAACQADRSKKNNRDYPKTVSSGQAVPPEQLGDTILIDFPPLKF
jgi:hypothetical protein